MQLIKELDNLLETTSLLEADKALCQIMAGLGCDKFSYNYYPIDFEQTGKARHVLCTEQVQGWQEHYTAQHYDEIDPILNRMRQSHLPLGWRLEEELHKYGKQQKHLFADAIEFGLSGGFAVPVHAPFGEFANLVVQDASVLKLIARHRDIKLNLQLIAYHYHSHISYLLSKNVSTDTVSLTSRELECLRMTVQHKTAKEIANILHITPRTVGFHIENVIKKLGVANKHQAVTKALQLSLLR